MSLDTMVVNLSRNSSRGHIYNLVQWRPFRLCSHNGTICRVSVAEIWGNTLGSMLRLLTLHAVDFAAVYGCRLAWAVSGPPQPLSPIAAIAATVMPMSPMAKWSHTNVIIRNCCLSYWLQIPNSTKQTIIIINCPEDACVGTQRKRKPSRSHPPCITTRS